LISNKLAISALKSQDGSSPSLAESFFNQGQLLNNTKTNFHQTLGYSSRESQQQEAMQSYCEAINYAAMALWGSRETDKMQLLLYAAFYQLTQLFEKSHSNLSNGNQIFATLPIKIRIQTGLIFNLVNKDYPQVFNKFNAPPKVYSLEILKTNLRKAMNSVDRENFVKPMLVNLLNIKYYAEYKYQQRQSAANTTSYMGLFKIVSQGGKQVVNAAKDVASHCLSMRR
jgi:hypothetical protein